MVYKTGQRISIGMHLIRCHKTVVQLTYQMINVQININLYVHYYIIKI